MGSVHPVVTLLAVWTTISVMLVAAWSYLAAREHIGFSMREPRSHVRVVDGLVLAPVIDLDAARRRSVRRSA